MPRCQCGRTHKSVPASPHPSEGSMTASPSWRSISVSRRTGPPGQGDPHLPPPVRAAQTVCTSGSEKPQGSSARTPPWVGCPWVAGGHPRPPSPWPCPSHHFSAHCKGESGWALLSPSPGASEGRRRGALCLGTPVLPKAHLWDQDGTARLLTMGPRCGGPSHFCSGHVPLAHTNALYSEKLMLLNKDNRVQVVPENVPKGHAVQHHLGALCPRVPAPLMAA